MLSKLNFSLITLLLVLSFTSCKKYEEGPVTLRTPKSRLTDKDWVVTENKINGMVQPVEDDEKNHVTRFDDDGKFYFISPEYTIQGKWEFIDGKDKLKITTKDPEDGEEGSLEFTILKLTKDELWLEGFDDYVDQMLEIHYKAR
jgi:hypothetical protein